MRKSKNADMHGGYAGCSLQDKIRALMDKQNKRARKEVDNYNPDEVNKKRINYARLEGMCATLAIIRSSSIQEEMRLSDERCGFV